MVPFSVRFERGAVGRNYSDISTLRATATPSLIEGGLNVAPLRSPCRGPAKEGRTVGVKNDGHREKKTRQMGLYTTGLKLENRFNTFAFIYSGPGARPYSYP